MTKKELKVCWISAGVSSFIAGYLAKDVDEFIYIDIENQHPDSMRFIKDCEKALGKEIQILQSPYKNKEAVIKQFRYINGVAGARCTEVLKKRPRKEWEYAHRDYDVTYVWGFDIEEKHRADRLLESMPEFHHEFPLIDKMLSKSDVHGLFERTFDFPRPKMYDMGYKNNNCIGCVKGGMGYWNKIRVDFPEVFKQMAKLEREVGHSCINGVYLDELDPNRGHVEDEVMPDCSILCQIAVYDVNNET
ncbi:MAG: hypothetical protein NC094_09000 [Bacteroidales bacterium]|nr:phosphoadenosine phosphosulfate reductase [Lachnoclostridium sp.]MCM1385141.1 phosphoadenosine phosphosulfate reductase [Lachnoclostridium sp.]MCM1465543.1 hypothetical protein [Bacteroidales bacterium]